MAESQADGGTSWWRQHWLVLVLSGVCLIALLVYTALAATVLPAWIVARDGGKVDENAIVNTRSALLGVLAPVVVAIGAVAAFLNYRETSAQNKRTYELGQKALEQTQSQNRDTLDVTRRGQLTERFTRAIEQLGQTSDDKLDIRLGGIYALEQIARESEELHGPVMEILTAFLREHSRKPEETLTTFQPNDLSTPNDASAADRKSGDSRLRADFQAIATVLGRRQLSHDPDGFTLDLRGVALDEVDFVRAQLQRANFTGAHLHKAIFEGAQLQKANFEDAQVHQAFFRGAQLPGANFNRAQLPEANFAFAHLRDATFEFAQLQHADFVGTQLWGANLNGAHLHRAVFAGAYLEGALFRGAQLPKAIFQDTDLREACFAGAHLGEADFVRADLEGAKFRYGEIDALDLTPEQLDGALNVDRAVLPKYLASAQGTKDFVRPAE